MYRYIPVAVECTVYRLCLPYRYQKQKSAMECLLYILLAACQWAPSSTFQKMFFLFGTHWLYEKSSSPKGVMIKCVQPCFKRASADPGVTQCKSCTSLVVLGGVTRFLVSCVLQPRCFAIAFRVILELAGPDDRLGMAVQHSAEAQSSIQIYSRSCRALI